MFYDFEEKPEKSEDKYATCYQPLLERLEKSLVLFHSDSILASQFNGTYKDHPVSEIMHKRPTLKDYSDNHPTEEEKDLDYMKMSFERDRAVTITRPSPKAIVDAMKKAGYDPWTCPLHGGALTLATISRMQEYITKSTMHLRCTNQSAVPFTQHVVRLAVERFLHYRYAADLPDAHSFPFMQRPTDEEEKENSKGPQSTWAADARRKKRQIDKVFDSFYDACPITTVITSYFTSYDRLTPQMISINFELARRCYDNAEFIVKLMDDTYSPLSVYFLRELLYLRSMMLLVNVMFDYERGTGQVFLKHFVYFLMMICKLHNAKEAQDLVDCVRLWDNLVERMDPRFVPDLIRHRIRSGIYSDCRFKWSLGITHGHFNADFIFKTPHLRDVAVPNEHCCPGHKNENRLNQVIKNSLPTTLLFNMFRRADHKMICLRTYCGNSSKCPERKRMLRRLAKVLELFVIRRCDDEMIYIDEVVPLDRYGIFEDDVSDNEETSTGRNSQRSSSTCSEEKWANVPESPHFDPNLPGPSTAPPPKASSKDGEEKKEKEKEKEPKLTAKGKGTEHARKSGDLERIVVGDNEFLTVKMKKVKVRC